MAAVLTALAVIGGFADILSFVSFGMDFEKPTQNYHVEVRAGNDHYDSSGHLPLVGLFNNNGGKRAWSDFGGDNTAQISKVEVQAGENDICLAWISVEDRSAGEKALFLGEVMKRCGASWYPSAVWMDIEGGREVDCAWLNNGHEECQMTNGNGDWHGFWIDQFWYWASSASAGAEGQKKNPQDACWQMGKYQTGQCQPQSKRAGVKRDQPAIYSTITRTSRPLAQRVCDDPNSHGPSLLSTSEGLLCDMRTRTLRPLCSNGQVPGCYQDTELEDSTSTAAVNLAGGPTASGGVQLSDDYFEPSPIKLDSDDSHANGTFVRRRETAHTKGYVVNYDHSRACNGCCVSTSRDNADNVNATHYWGYGVESPTPYRNVTGGIYIAAPDGVGNKTYVADCGFSIDVTNYVHQSAGEKSLGGGSFLASLAVVALVIVLAHP